VGDREVKDVIWNYPEPFNDCVDCKDLVAFYWNKVDAWFEEDEQVFIGPKDPYTRVDILKTSRHVTVAIDGEQVADSKNAYMLIETGLPVRYYIPKEDVRMDVLKESDRTVGSPYKGMAKLYNVEVNGRTIELAAWSYEEPFKESERIAGHICFPQGKVEMYVNGVREPNPQTRWDR
jgi:uncharacterized protein (DUF427 family)